MYECKFSGRLKFKRDKTMIDVNRLLKARVYDADTSWFDTNTLEVDVQQIILPHPPYTKRLEIVYNGGSSSAFDFLPQD